MVQTESSSRTAAIHALGDARRALGQFANQRSRNFAATLRALHRFVVWRRAARPPWRRHFRVCWGRFVALAVVAISFAFLAIDSSSTARSPVMNTELGGFIAAITHFGSSDWVLVPAVLILIMSGCLNWTVMRPRALAAWTNRAQVAWFILLSVGGAGLIATILKQAIGRARPTAFDQNGVAAFRSWSFEYDYASFPSGHATTAAAFCTAIALLYPYLRIAAAAVLLWTAASRSLMNVHYPSDVVAGSLLGIWFTYFVASHFARSGLLFNIDAVNCLVPKRGLFATHRNLEWTLKRAFQTMDFRLRGSRKSISLAL